MTSRRSSIAGFSLIELLVAVAIITLLTSIVLATTQTVRSRARDTQRISDVRQMQNALELFYTSNFRYPDSDNCGATQPNTSWCNSAESQDAFDHWILDDGGTNLSEFIRITPIDPRQVGTPNWTPENGGTYYYYSSDADNNQWYMLVFGLENFPHDLETQDGVTNCSDVTNDYGNNNGVITVGVDCP